MQPFIKQLTLLVKQCFFHLEIKVIACNCILKLPLYSNICIAMAMIWQCDIMEYLSLEDHLALNVVDICLDNMLLIPCKLLKVMFCQIWKTEYLLLNIWQAKIWKFRIVYLTLFLTDFNSLDLKIWVRVFSVQNWRNFENQKEHFTS